MMRWISRKKNFFVPFVLSEGIFFNVCALSQCIVYWTHFQNMHTFTYQKILLHTLFKIIHKAFSVSLSSFLNRKLQFSDVSTKTYYFRRENNADIQAMYIATGFHIFLMIFEVLLSTNLQYNVLPYRIVFIPIYCMSVLSVIACVWGYRHERQLEVRWNQCFRYHSCCIFCIAYVSILFLCFESSFKKNFKVLFMLDYQGTQVSSQCRNNKKNLKKKKKKKDNSP